VLGVGPAIVIKSTHYGRLQNGYVLQRDSPLSSSSGLRGAKGWAVIVIEGRMALGVGTVIAIGVHGFEMGP
jgi:hypothetical protein